MENSSSFNINASVILNKVYEHTNYVNKHNADAIFKQIKDYLPLIATKDKHAIEIISKYSSFSRNVTNQEMLKDMIKLIWRTTKVLYGQPQYKLSLFIIGLAAIFQGIKPLYKDKIDHWMNSIVLWLGCQLTIGGKGVTGEGEGDVLARISQFFSTPYLHDFD